MMNRVARLSPICLAVALVVVAATTASAANEVLSVHYHVSFAATSTLHDFEGRSGPQTATAVALGTGKDDGWKADIRLPVSSLDTGNSWRDEKMQAMFDTEHYPDIRAELDAIDPNAARPSPDGTGRLPFQLTIRDVTHPVAGVVSNWKESSDRVEFDVRFDILLHEFNLEPPSTLGVLRVGDRVEVTVHAVVTAS